jgi:uncharacterized RDD family membrane protein YckC
MTPTHTCPQCGAALPADAPESLCPACLMSGALPSESDPGATMIVEKPKVRALPSVGETFGGYRIERELGRGGMGAVYAAEHLESGRRVALKVLSHQLDSPEARARFLREGRLAASINHPNSVYVFGTEEIEGTPAIAMELIAGGTLQDRIQRTGALPVGEAVDAVLQIIAGLEAAHAVGILHRDIKPANCFTDLDGSVKVGDFGLSISTQGRGDSLHTIDGTFLGTPAFCSPEQLRGEELNVRSDMYSVGVTLFYLLTGRTPFEGKNMVQMLANALEKTPPPPSQFRSEIPVSLDRIVLRCLSKQATERFGSYAELRLALTPFSSTAPAPAALGMRFVAVIIDVFFLSVMSWLLMAAGHALYYGDISSMGDPTRMHGGSIRWISFAIFVFKLGYWGVLEGLWGASVGKAFLGLRVARLNRGVPGIPRAMARQLVLGWPSLLSIFFFNDYFNQYDPTSRTTQMWSFVYLGAGAAYLLAMFVTARRANGFAAVQDLLTSTRVIQKATHQQRVIVAQADTPVMTTEATPKLGPYHALTTLSTGGDETILLGYDTRLLRKVWIRQTRAGAPPVTPKLRNIARPGRLRWLQGERNATESWDAYEAVEGKCLCDLVTERQPWSSVRHWLNDLGAELEASARDGAMPAVLALDRVWITTDGRAKLLDFATPGVTRPQPSAQADLAPGVFLNQIAISALEGRHASVEEAASHPASAPLSLSAHAFLRSLTTAAADLNFTDRLKPLLQESPVIAWWKRATMVVLTALPALGLGAFFLMGAVLMQSWRKSDPELMPFLSMVMEHRTLERGSNPRPDSGKTIAEQKAALEIIIAGRHGHIVRDPKLWSSSVYKLIIQPDARAKVERMVADHPNIGPEELKQAEAVLAPMIKALDDAEKHSQKTNVIENTMGSIAVFMVFSMLAVMAVLSLACALIFRRGPLFRILGIAVVTQSGAEASRLRMLGRGLIAWSPVLFGAVLLKLMPINDRTPLAPFIMLALLATGLAIASLCQRKRGLHDMLAGTWPVPQ